MEEARRRQSSESLDIPVFSSEQVDDEKFILYHKGK